MRFNGTQKFGVSMVYRIPYGSYGCEVRFTNLSEKEVRENLECFGKPDSIATSRKNKESKAIDTRSEARELVDRLKAEFGFTSFLWMR